MRELSCFYSDAISRPAADTGLAGTNRIGLCLSKLLSPFWGTNRIGHGVPKSLKPNVGVQIGLAFACQKPNLLQT